MASEGEWWVCRRCGFKTRKEGGPHQVVEGKGLKKKEIPVVDLEKQKSKISTIDEPCPKCGARETMWEIRQTRGTDEPATRFFRCLKCGHTWREYS